MGVSIIIPVYNKSNTIAQTIESVVHQLAAEDELLLIDDGSTDNSAEIIKNYLADNVILYQKENGGESDARNYGIKKAKNEWLAFLDGDDVFSENYLENTKKHISYFKNKDVVITHMTKQIKGGKTIEKNKQFVEFEKNNRGIEDKGTYYHIDNFFKTSIKIPIVSASSLVIKKERTVKTGPFIKGIKRGADREFYIRLFRENPELFLLKDSYAILNQDDAQRVSRNIRIPYKHELAYIHRKEKKPFIKSYLRFHLVRRVILLLRSGQPLQAFKLITLLRYHIA